MRSRCALPVGGCSKNRCGCLVHSRTQSVIPFSLARASPPSAVRFALPCKLRCGMPFWVRLRPARRFYRVGGYHVCFFSCLGCCFLCLLGWFWACLRCLSLLSVSASVSQVSHVGVACWVPCKACAMVHAVRRHGSTMPPPVSSVVCACSVGAFCPCAASLGRLKKQGLTPLFFLCSILITLGRAFYGRFMLICKTYYYL